MEEEGWLLPLDLLVLGGRGFIGAVLVPLLAAVVLLVVVLLLAPLSEVLPSDFLIG